MLKKLILLVATILIISLAGYFYTTIHMSATPTAQDFFTMLQPLDRFNELTDDQVVQALSLNMQPSQPQSNPYFLIQEGQTNDKYLSSLIESVELRTAHANNRNNFLVLTLRDTDQFTEDAIRTMYSDLSTSAPSAHMPPDASIYLGRTMPWGKISYGISPIGVHRVVSVIFDLLDNITT